MFITLLITKLNFPARLYHNWIVKISLRLLQDLDLNMKKAHWPRHKRRQFWRDFVGAQYHAANVHKVIGKTIKKRRKL